MTKSFKPPMGCVASLLLLLNAMLFIPPRSVLFARAHSSIEASSDIIRRDLAEDNKDKKNNDRNDKGKDVRNKDAENIDPIEPDVEDDEKPVAPFAPEHTILMPSESDVDSFPNIVDGSKFLAATKLKPITFKMNVKKITSAANTTALHSYMKDFIEEILDMKSNRDWYPSHSKSVENLSIHLETDDAEYAPMAAVLEGSRKQNSVINHPIPVRLIVNGVVFVHSKYGDVVQTAPPTTGKNERKNERKNGDPQPRTIFVQDSTSGSKFYDSFDHSMLLYYTFWGVDDLQKVLEKDGGLRKPKIGSVTLGEKKLIAFGVDKDDNFAYNGDHSSSKRSSAKTISQAESIKSSARKSTTYGFLSFLLISSAISIFL